MSPDKFEEMMRRLEVFHGARVPESAWPIIRVDGRGFTALTNAQYDKPFDYRFKTHMSRVATELVRNLGGLLAYYQSDEVSVLLPQSVEMFDRRAEKLATVAAGLASSVFAVSSFDSTKFFRTYDDAPHFDGRLIVAETLEWVVDYFRWR